jgi:hypothetical protein
LLSVFVAVKAVKGTPLMGLHLPLTVTEACALTLTTVLAHRVARSMREYEDAALQLGLLEAPAAASFDAAQSELYREVRRARRQCRPLALAAVKLAPQHVPAAIPRVIENVQKSCAQELVTRRLADVLVRSVEDEGWVIQRGDHFLVLLPESNPEQALEIIQRAEQAAAAELGVELRRGLAAFPEEEITFTGLVERAEAQMRGDETSPPEHGWRLPAANGEPAHANGNGNGRVHRLDSGGTPAKTASHS